MITVVTSSDSRACVHSDWIVYIAEPSASSASTGRSGQATAAPVATRQALADRPAGELQPVVRRRSPPSRRVMRTLVVLRLVGDDRALGQRRGDRRGEASAPVSAPVGRAGPAGGDRRLRRRRRRRRRARARRAGRVVAGPAQHVHLAASGTRSLGLPG